MMQQEQHKQLVLSLMCVVCDRERKEKVVSVLEGQKSFFNLASLGKGTANSKILSYLGLGQTEKAVFFSIMPYSVAKGALQAVDEKLDLARPGHGIAFLARVHEGCYHKPVVFADGETGGSEMEQQNIAHDLVMVVLNRGYTEEVMDVARKAGATGGTVLHARGCGLAGAEKFFGVTIQPEKEMIMMVAAADASCEIMGAIADEAGPGTEAGAVSFSMPLTAVRGLGSQQDVAGQAK